MSRWRAEYDDGIWRFYRDGMELGLYEKGDVVIDALNNAESRIAELTECIGSQMADVYTLKARIAELEADNAEFRQLIRDWSIVLEQDDYFQLWHVESVRQAMLEINKEREE